MKDEIPRSKREKLHKWGKARKIMDEDRISPVLMDEKLYIFKVEGDSNVYRVGVDIETGKSFCPCPFVGEQCSHQLAAHLYLAGIGVEDENL